MNAENTSKDAKQNYYTVLEGGHKTVSKTALALATAGEEIRVRNGNYTDALSISDTDAADIDLLMYDKYTNIVVGDFVQCTIRDDSHVIVRTD